MLAMSKETRRSKLLRRAVVAVLIEPLEQRRLLTTCDTGTNPMILKGDDGVDNRITISFNSGTGRISVTDSAATVTGCTNLLVSSIQAFGGASTTASHTGTGADVIDASALPSNI